MVIGHKVTEDESLQLGGLLSAILLSSGLEEKLASREPVFSTLLSNFSTNVTVQKRAGGGGIFTRSWQPCRAAC